ncbi:MAG: hypothetical protein QOJ26_1611 [Thermoplasmata archaeon]|nr:hypothetical protein [Thermoplasmata archaeon]
MPLTATPSPSPTSVPTPWVAAAVPYQKDRLAIAAALVFLVANALPLVFLPASFNDTCDVDDGTDCWGAGMAVLFLLVMAPFALYGFVVGTMVLTRIAAGRALAMPIGSWSVLKVGAWLLGAPLGLLVTSIPGLLLEGRPGAEALLVPAALGATVGPYVAFAGWWILAILLSRLAFTGAWPRAA